MLFFLNLRCFLLCLAAMRALLIIQTVLIIVVSAMTGNSATLTFCASVRSYSALRISVPGSLYPYSVGDKSGSVDSSLRPPTSESPVSLTGLEGTVSMLLSVALSLLAMKICIVHAYKGIGWYALNVTNYHVHCS